MKKANPLDIATKTINEVYEIMARKPLDQDWGDYVSLFSKEEFTQCVDLLADCRLKLDRIAAAKAKQKDMDMKERDDQKAKKLKGDLAGLERDYVNLARMNPQSTNDTQSHMANIDKIVRDMKRIRGRLGMYSSHDTYLKDLLYPARSGA